MATTYEKQLVGEVLRTLPVGSLLSILYEPESGVRPEVARACRMRGMDPRSYLVEVTGTSENSRGEPLLHGVVINRGGERRTFAPFRGKLTKIDVLRIGPGPRP